LDLYIAMDIEAELALRTLHANGLARHRCGDTLRNLDRLLTNARHGAFLHSCSRDQKTVQRTSPPTFCSRASWSAMTPLGVETIAMPRPFDTRGSLSTDA